MKTSSFLPQLSEVDAATGFVEETLLSEGCPAGIAMKLCIVTDELFSNIGRYSGAAESTIACGVENGAAVLIFSDDGAPYDPTAAKEPDVTLPAEDRGVGGLGIHMVRKFVTDLTYERSGGRNVLTARKTL